MTREQTSESQSPGSVATTRPRGSRGFSLVEVLVFLAVSGMVASVGVPMLSRMVHRTKLEAVARETSIFMNLGRLSAIRECRAAQVRIDTSSSQILVFIDLDEDRALDPGEPTLGQNWLPSGVSFEDPAGQTGIDSVLDLQKAGDQAFVTFNTDGSVVATGAVRFADTHENFLEVAITSRTTGQIEVRKWNGTEWTTPGEGGNPWQWN